MSDDPQTIPIERISGLLPERLRRELEAAIEASCSSSDPRHHAESYFGALHLSESDRNLLLVAFSLWRGFGPVLNVQSLWGMDRELATRTLSALALAIDVDGADELLRDAAELSRKER
ncbi:MAG: hypothetical protein QGG40_00905 [Myxococcota bacterium]|jgi:hypothetical protein|nr:hypothetical protein [Myxococcota bacterium]